MVRAIAVRPAGVQAGVRNQGGLLTTSLVLHCPVCLRERGEAIYYAPRQKHCVICQCDNLEPMEWLEDSQQLPSTVQVLGDPAASFWLKDALQSALQRDPVDAANDADVLARLLDRCSRAILKT
jgi:hypothetical protein